MQVLAQDVMHVPQGDTPMSVGDYNGGGGAVPCIWSNREVICPIGEFKHQYKNLTVSIINPKYDSSFSLEVLTNGSRQVNSSRLLGL